ncbi:MAG: LptF/LptG family permease, partial [Candidatus Omnitrophica bacterium]|nr:LptF/LptG family permease [Candidatus Omnitrophota bacterium]
SSILTFSVKNFVSPVLLKKINRILEVSVVFTSSNYFFHSEKVEGKKFINVEFTEYFEEGNFRTYKAEIAENYKNNNWIFKNGFLWEFDRMKNLVKKGKFDFINIEIPLTAEILTISNIDVETYSFFQLFKIIRDMKKIKLNPVSLKCYLHEKISYPLLNLFMVFVIYGFLKRSSKISNLYVFSFSFLFSFFIYFFYIFMFSLSKNARIPPFLGCWLIQIFLIIHFLVTKKMES